MKKTIGLLTVVALAGALFTGCNSDMNAGDNTSSMTDSVPSPSEIISDIPSAVEGLISDVESDLEGMGSSLAPSSTSHP